MFKRFILTLPVCCAMALACAPPSLAAEGATYMDTAYVVVAAKNMDAAAPMIEYIEDGGVKCVRGKPEASESVQGKKYFIVIGSPKDDDQISGLAQKALSSIQWKNASKMGKSGMVIASYEGSDIMFMFSDYSLTSLVGGSKDRWTEQFYDWYEIPLNMVQIIGY